MEQGVNALVEGTEQTDKRINGQTTALVGTRARIAKVAEDLDLLDRSIPQRFRARVVPPADPAAKKTAAKPNPRYSNAALSRLLCTAPKNHLTSA